MTIVLFALLGALIDANAAYWICFAVFVVFKVLALVVNFMDKANR